VVESDGGADGRLHSLDRSCKLHVVEAERYVAFEGEVEIEEEVSRSVGCSEVDAGAHGAGLNRVETIGEDYIDATIVLMDVELVRCFDDLFKMTWLLFRQAVTSSKDGRIESDHSSRDVTAVAVVNRF